MTHDHKTGPASRDPAAIWDDILDLVAEDDAETGQASEAVREWSQQLEARVKSRVAELRRRLTPIDVPIQRGVTIPPEVQALDRDAIVARIESLRKAGVVRYSHHELTGLSDHNLRIALSLAMALSRK